MSVLQLTPRGYMLVAALVLLAAFVARIVAWVPVEAAAVFAVALAVLALLLAVPGPMPQPRWKIKGKRGS